MAPHKNALSFSGSNRSHSFNLVWQRQAFTMLVPRSGLTYGFFLTPVGAKARFWVLTCPLRVGLTCLSICFIAALVSGWRVGTRSLLACMIPWWLTAFLITSGTSCTIQCGLAEGRGRESVSEKTCLAEGGRLCMWLRNVTNFQISCSPNTFFQLGMAVQRIPCCKM
jgi:hypothetical protein